MTIQPQIPVGLTLLASGYEHDGLMLDLYGTIDSDRSADSDGIEVNDVSLTGERVSLAALFTLEQMEKMSEWCDQQFKRNEAQRSKDDEIDRAYHAMMR